MSKKIPYIGQYGIDAAPYKEHVSKVSWGPSTDYDVKVTSTGTYPIWSVPAGTVVEAIKSHVSTASTDMVATLGDSDDVDGFMTDTNMAPLSAGSSDKILIAAAGAWAAGRFYDAATDINLTVTTANTAGAGTLYLWYSMAGLDTDLESS